MITHKELKELLSYDPDTGDFWWKESAPGRTTKKPAGGISKGRHVGQYRQLMIDGKKYMASHLAWFYVHGEWPEHEMDHINHNPLDDRITNLRPCTHSENQANKRIQKNNTSGVKGVTWVKSRNRWQVAVGRKGGFVGQYKTIEEAMEAYEKASRERFGDFAHTG